MFRSIYSLLGWNNRLEENIKTDEKKANSNEINVKKVNRWKIFG